MKLLFVVTLFLAPAWCRAATLPPEFEGSRVNSSGVVYLKAARSYKALNAAQKAEAVGKAAAALNPAKPLAVELDGEGELWNIKDGRAVKLDSWSDKAVSLGPRTKKTGRWFGSFGIQSMDGGSYPSSTVNLRFGSTLYKNRYDLALAYDYSKPRDSVLSRVSIGLIGRALMPLSRHGGWNIGAQLSTVDNYGVEETKISLITGLNVYLPRGSFDITLNLQDKGAYGFLAGYTVFIGR